MLPIKGYKTKGIQSSCGDLALKDEQLSGRPTEVHVDQNKRPN